MNKCMRSVFPTSHMNSPKAKMAQFFHRHLNTACVGGAGEESARKLDLLGSYQLIPMAVDQDGRRVSHY